MRTSRTRVGSGTSNLALIENNVQFDFVNNSQLHARIEWVIESLAFGLGY